jgi:hypothetical protein
MACKYLYQGKWYTEEQLKGVYNQLGGSRTTPSKASPGTIKKIKEFLDRIGVETQSLAKITYNGQSLGVNGLADPLNGLIQVIEGKEDIALPEEAMHMAVELLEQKNPKLFKEMMDRVGRYNLFNEVMLEYRNNRFYQTKEGTPDIRKIKKETIGKILAQTVINKNEKANEKPELLDQTRNWWQKIVDFLKDLFLRAGFNPFESAAAKVLSGKLKGDLNSADGVFLERSPNAVNATLKLIHALQSTRARKWFETLYTKGQQDLFFNKIQQDLQAPKGQVEMLKKLMQGKQYTDIGTLITDVMTELSYTIEVNLSTVRLDNDDKRDYDNFTLDGETYSYNFIIFEKRRESDEDSGMDEYTRNGDLIEREEYNRAYKKYRELNKKVTPSQAYVGLTVPGGANYRENEIKTPDITPSIKGHAAFASDKGIGWFRSDDRAHTKMVERTEWNPNDEKVETFNEERIGEITKTRRILEIQSDLFQKSRPRWDEKLQGWTVGNETYSKKEDAELVARNLVAMEWLPVETDFGPGREQGMDLDKNNFLNILADENNWVTFFVKAIIQDSAKKGYENVRFPGGNTANKIEGQTTIEEYIENKKRDLKTVELKIASHEKGAIDKDFFMFENSFEGDTRTYEEIRESQLNDLRNEAEQYRKEIADAEGGEGLGKFGAINRFYENTIQNILKKQGYDPKEVTDEFGNKWFEVEIKGSRDLSDFYFQISGQTLGDKIFDRHVNISKRGDEFEINGNKIKNSVQKEIQAFYKSRIGAENADKALRGYKQETENKVGVDIQDILNRYIDDDGKLRITPLPQTNPSSVDPVDNSFYMTLEAHLQERLNSYEPGTEFLHAVNLYDGINTAARADLITITPQGAVDILQFKVPQLSRTSPDIPVYRQEAYNLEIEQLRKILQRGYGVSRTDFRQTRAIPIKAEYEQLAPNVSDMRLSKLTIGNVNVALIQDDLLIPISSESEAVEGERFDDFIKRLKGLAQKLASERVAPEQRAERNARVAQLVAAIRKLQIKKDGKGIIASARTIIKRAKETSSVLKDKIANTDPNVATIEELNKIAEDILSDKDQVEVYKDLYQAFKSIFTDGTVESQDIIKDAREISDDANDIIDSYWETAVHFRTKKFAAKIGIKDEFTPEKKLTWYRRMVRSISQSSIKAGGELWKLIERINGKFKLEFLDRLDELGKIEKKVAQWMKGRPIEELYKKIFQYDDKGRWTGKIIQKIDREFYRQLERAQGNKDRRWINENIDRGRYMEWFRQEHQRRIDDTRNARYSADDAENNRIKQQKLQDFVDTFHIDFNKGIGTYNWALKNFPREDRWKSAAYLEIENNEALLGLYDYYRKRLEESWELGMLHEHNGWSWFPNVRRNLLEKLSTAPAGGKVGSLLGKIRIEAEDQTFGKIDPITGKPVDEVHANFVSDLGTWVKEADDSYFLDYSEKSMDIFKVIALWDAEILKYRLRVESEGIARLLYYTEADPRRKAYESTVTGKLKRTADQKPILVSNEVNAQYIKDHIDAAYYGKEKSNEFDVAVSIPYKSVVEKINGLFGTEVLTVPAEENVRISGIKLIETLNRYHVTKTLGLNVMTSVAQLFGGSVNTFINQGRYFNKKDMLEAELKYVSGKFYKNDEDKKIAGLVSFLHPYNEDRTSAMVRNLSVSKMVEYLSSDHLFYLQRGSDNWVNTIVALSMIKNTMVVEGKLVNIREFARRELGHANKYSGTYEESKDFDKRLEARVLELQKSPQALINVAQITNDRIVVQNIDRNGDEVIKLRQKILEMIKDALGNTSSEDLSLYKRSVMWKSFFMYKNWIPRMLDTRVGSLKYSPGTDKYEYGRFRMLVNGVRHLGVTSTASLVAKLGNDPKPLIEVAKREYQRKREAFAEEQQELEMSEAEFIDMYVKGVRAEIKELLLAASLMAILITMRVMAPEGDEDPETRGMYRWALRGLDKLTDELTFMYTPTSFTNILNSSVFPSVGILVEFEKFFVTVVKKLFWNVMGDEEKAEKQHILKHVFRALPVTKELINYLAIFNEDLAREYGVRMTANYGSIR